MNRVRLEVIHSVEQGDSEASAELGALEVKTSGKSSLAVQLEVAEAKAKAETHSKTSLTTLMISSQVLDAKEAGKPSSRLHSEERTSH